MLLCLGQSREYLVCIDSTVQKCPYVSFVHGPVRFTPIGIIFFECHYCQSSSVKMKPIRNVHVINNTSVLQCCLWLCASLSFSGILKNSFSSASLHSNLTVGLPKTSSSEIYPPIKCFVCFKSYIRWGSGEVWGG